MTFDEAMRMFPGLYSEADRGMFEQALGATQTQNAAQQAADAAAIQQRAALAQQQMAAMNLSPQITAGFDLSGTGYGSANQQALFPQTASTHSATSDPTANNPFVFSDTAYRPVATSSSASTSSDSPATSSGGITLNNAGSSVGSFNTPFIGTSTTGAAPGSNYTYQQLLDFYRQANGGNPSSGDAFNSWVGAQGITGWTDPTNAPAGSAGTTTTGVQNPFGPPTSGPSYGGTGRNLPGELNAIGSFLSPFAQAGLANFQQFSPAYAQQNIANYGAALQGVAGPMNAAYNQANPWISQQGSQLQDVYNFLNTHGAPQWLQAQGYDAATASPTLAPNAAAAQQAGTFNPIANAAKAQVAGGYAPFGWSNVNPNTGFTAVSAPASSYGLDVASSRLGSLGPSNIQQTLEQQANRDLSLGRGLSDEERMDARQNAREAWGARGLINSTGSIADEVLNLDRVARQREAERRAFAQGVDATGFAQRQQEFGNALGLSNAALGYGTLGLDAQRANLGAQLQGNQLGLQGQLANQGAQLQGGQANAGLGLDWNRLATATNQFNAQEQNQMALANANLGLNWGQLGTQNNQFNTGQQNQLALQNANFANQLALANAAARNQASQYGAGAQNAMNQFNQQNALNFGQQGFQNALGIANWNQQNAINPFAPATAITAGTPDYTNALLGYGSDLFGGNWNAQNAQQISAGNNKAGTNSALISGGSAVAAAAIKAFFICIPEGEKVDTPEGPKTIEEVRTGDVVLGYRGTPVKVVQKHEYNENPSAYRFFRYTLDDGAEFAVCDMHRVEGIRTKNRDVGDIVGGKCVIRLQRFGGVRRSYDLLTEDSGYSMAGVPVNSMIPELNAAAASLERSAA